MNGSLRQGVRITLIALAGLIGGCTYNGKLDQSFHTPTPRQSLEGGRVPLSIAVVHGAALQRSYFVAAANGYAVNIPLGEPLAAALQAELAGIFAKSGIVEDAGKADYDLYVYPEVKWIEVYRDRTIGHLRYKAWFGATIRSGRYKYAVSDFETTRTVDYTPPGEAVGAQVLTGASLFLLAPLTVPLTTQAVGGRAKPHSPMTDPTRWHGSGRAFEPTTSNSPARRNPFSKREKAKRGRRNLVRSTGILKQ
jgi:hypothetical protein